MRILADDVPLSELAFHTSVVCGKCIFLHYKYSIKRELSRYQHFHQAKGTIWLERTANIAKNSGFDLKAKILQFTATKMDCSPPFNQWRTSKIMEIEEWTEWVMPQ